MRSWSGVAVVCCLAVAAAAQSARDLNVKEYEKRKLEELVEIGQRHVDLGWSIRKTGLQQQATFQFVRAVELSEGQHRGASMVLGIVRNYGEAFWRKARKKPTRASLLRYQKKAAAIEVKNQKSHAKLAKFAQKARLDEQARGHWLTAMQLGAELEINSRGAKIGGQKVAPEHVEWLQEQTIEVGGERRFDAGSVARKPGAAAPQLSGFVEASSDQVVVRTDLPEADCKELCALGTALCEPLAERLEGLPVKPLRLLVFGKRADYDAYLSARGYGDATHARGLCDYLGYQAMLCAEGLEPADLQALVLHELTHLFFWGTSPVTMPDFYSEGLAETFGGQGTFTWDGKKLATGGPMRQDRVAAVKQNPLPLAELIAVDALRLLGEDRDRAMVFYAQCQLLQRFLLEPGGKWEKRFEWWENECRGSLPGSTSTARPGDARPARAAFERLFAQDLEAIETAFRAWLAEQ